MDQSLEERVGKGMRLLDSLKPNWWVGVNTDNILVTQERCDSFENKLGIDPEVLRWAFPDEGSYYFHGLSTLFYDPDAKPSGRSQLAMALTDEWRRQIAARQKSAQSFFPDQNLSFIMTVPVRSLHGLLSEADLLRLHADFEKRHLPVLQHVVESLLGEVLRLKGL